MAGAGGSHPRWISTASIHEKEQPTPFLRGGAGFVTVETGDRAEGGYYYEVGVGTPTLIRGGWGQSVDITYKAGDVIEWVLRRHAGGPFP